MQDIVSSVAHVFDIMGEIASASDEQSRGISQIAQAVSELDTTTQQNAALVEESSSAANSLEEQSRILAQAVSAFHLGDDAHASGERPSARRCCWVNRVITARNRRSEKAWATNRLTPHAILPLKGNG
ncbi:Methyl-accepting chemotaxis protein III [Dickeya solani]|nr:Methyl-accepting chemotaxis protein III [Dickeya solani]